MHPKLPVFIPFLGAYVQYTRGNPWQTARVAIAGPIFGGLASLACYVAGRQQGSDLLLALAYFGFFLNLFNLIPVGIFDGGAVWRSARWLRVGGGATKAMVVYVALLRHGLALVVGMIASHVPRRPRVTTTAKILDDGHLGDRRVGREDRRRVPRRLREGRADRPPGGRAVRLGAGRRRTARRTARRARSGASSPRPAGRSSPAAAAA